jgi:SprT-like family
MITRNQKISRAMRAIWREANAKFFDGALPRPHFRVRSLDHLDARALWESNHKNLGETISVDPDAFRSGAGLIRLMLHEMIHQLQWQQKSPRTQAEHHGRFFQRHCLRIRKLTGYNVFLPQG